MMDMHYLPLADLSAAAHSSEQAPEKIVNKSAVNVLWLYMLIPLLIGMSMVSHGGKAEPRGDNGNNKMRITTKQPGQF